MSIELKLASLAETAKRVRHTLESEEATKTALILPFLMALEYSVFDPTEVVPEYRADLKGVKHQERVDYAILRKGEPIILIEAKQASASLGDKNQIRQLYRYWNETPAKVGILTNGIEYRFYGDTDQDNKMDETPFLIVDITKLSERDVASVSAFSKYNYDLEDTAKLSEELYYQNAIRKVMIEACKDPQTPFARWMMTRTYEGLKTASKIEWFKDQIRIALNDFCVANHQNIQAQDGVTPTDNQVDKEAPRSSVSKEDWVPLEDFEGKSGTKPPSTIGFEDGEESDIVYWNQILKATGEYLIREGLLGTNKCPITAGQGAKRLLVSTTPQHPSGRSFANSIELADGLHMELNFRGPGCVEMAQFLMKQCDADPSQVWLNTG